MKNIVVTSVLSLAICFYSPSTLVLYGVVIVSLIFILSMLLSVRAIKTPASEIDYPPMEKLFQRLNKDYLVEIKEIDLVALLVLQGLNLLFFRGEPVVTLVFSVASMLIARDLVLYLDATYMQEFTKYLDFMEKNNDNK